MQICYHHLYFVDRIARLSIQNMLPAPATSQVLEELTAVAMGRRPAERIVENARLVNVHSQEILEGSVAITSGRIAAVGEVHGSGPDTEVIDAQGAYVLPGYVEPHAHPWMIATPDSYGEYALRRGTTTIAGEMLNMQAETTPTGMRRIHDDLQRMPIRWFWTVRATGQSGEELEEIFPWADWEDYLAHEDVAVLGEVTGWPQALAGDPELLRRIAAARRRGLAVDAHSAGAGPKRIPGLAAAGFTSDHEAITVEEARAALRAGLNVQLRHSSLRPDIETLLPLIQETDAWHRLAITTDGAAPAWSGRYGLADGIVRIPHRARDPDPEGGRSRDPQPGHADRQGPRPRRARARLRGRPADRPRFRRAAARAGHGGRPHGVRARRARGRPLPGRLGRAPDRAAARPRERARRPRELPAALGAARHGRP